MLYFFTPYSFDKKLFEAFDSYMSLISDPNDWVCFMDGDTAFLMSGYGHQIQNYIKAWPDTGLFTCYASRCHYACQRYPDSDMENFSILYHRQKAEEVFNIYNGQIVEINRRIAGHLMIIQKKTWLMIRQEVKETAADKNILGVDTKISNVILKANLKIRLMKGIYIFHYLRLAEGINNTNHLI
jgi:hypothetical protein